jgi:solute carrier family 35 protein F5
MLMDTTDTKTADAVNIDNGYEHHVHKVLPSSANIVYHQSPPLNTSTVTLPRKLLSFIRNRFVIGLLSLSLVVILWSSDGFIIGEVLDGFEKPFFLTYFSVATLQLYFIGILIRMYFRRRKEKRAHRSGSMLFNDGSLSFAQDPSVNNDQDTVNLEGSISSNEISMSPTPISRSDTPAGLNCLAPMTRMEIFRLALCFFLVYFTASYFANAAFHDTDTLSAAILMSTSCFFTLLLCVMFRIDRFTLMKGLSVLICAAGVFILFFAIKNDSKNALKGNMYALASAILYGVYSVMAKKVIVDESRVDMPLFFGFVGFLSMFTLWPIFIILHYTNEEPFELPPTGMHLGLLFIKNLFGTFLSNYCWLIALLYTTPLVVAIGLSLITPLTLIISVCLGRESFISYKALTGLFIIIGFLIVNFTEIYPKFNYFWENLLFSQKLPDPQPGSAPIESQPPTITNVIESTKQNSV